MTTLSKKDKLLWNEAVRKTLNEVKTSDGIIPDDDEREYLAIRVYEKVAYKSDNPFNKSGMPPMPSILTGH